MVGKIFINYRRGDDPGFAGRLFDRLEDAFQPSQLFMDVDSIPAGQDFARVLEDQVGQTDVLLAVVGRNWIDARDEQGRRRLDNPDDFVRIEIEAGLRLGKLVIPVLVNGAEMPRADALPSGLEAFTRRNAVRLTHDRFRADTQGLIEQIKRVLAAAEDAAREADRKAREQAEKEARALVLDRNRIEALRRAAQDGVSADEIKKVEELANWEFIRAINKPQDFLDHIARFPGGVCEGMARKQLEALAWASVKSTRDEQMLHDFLTQFPKGEFAQQARADIARLKEQQIADQQAAEARHKETEAWFLACSRNGSSDYREFLEKWPDSVYLHEARSRLLQAEADEKEASENLRSAVFAAPLAALIVGVIARIIANLLWVVGAISEASVEPIYLLAGFVAAVAVILLKAT